MKKLLALLLVLLVLSSAFVVVANAQTTTVLDEITQVIILENEKHEITQDNIIFSYCEKLTDDKYLVRYIIDKFEYTTEHVVMTLGDYTLVVYQRPLPQIYKNNELYDLEEAFDLGILSDDDLKIMSSLDKFMMYKVKNTQGVYDSLLEQYDLYSAQEYGELFYNEIGTIDDDSDNTVDYVVIFSHVALGSDAIGMLDLGTRFIWNSQLYYPFIYGYALYDVKNDKFIVFNENLLKDYPFMSKYIDELEIGVPYGDADHDLKITVRDATYIQRVIAKKQKVSPFDDEAPYPSRRSDFNRDGSVDILDASAIQIALAKTTENG